MTGDEFGLGFYTGDESKGRPSKPSVFGVPDQAEVVARIDAVSDDDMDSTFFDDSIQDVEDAATRVFDIGVRTIAHDGTLNEPVMTFGAPRSVSSSARPAAPAHSLILTGQLGRSPAARRAFILGGPAALQRA